MHFQCGVVRELQQGLQLGKSISFFVDNEYFGSNLLLKKALQ